MSMIAEALRILGIEDLVLGVHDSCFPSAKGEDVGRGSPNGQGARDLVDFAAELGFTGLQLGPQGETSDDDPSPYDGAIFTRSHRSIALPPLVEMKLISRGTLDRLAGDQVSDTSDQVAAGLRIRTALDEAFSNATFSDALPFVERERRWLERDGLFDAIAHEHGGADFTHWPAREDRELFADPVRLRERRALHAAQLARFGMVQWLADLQHQAFRAHVHSRKMSLIGDFQVGWSRRDLWAWPSAFMHEFSMGAPPSRTNPAGQPWGYALLDPDLGPEASALFDLRLDHALSLYDGLRIDHPHGLVCPWVYRHDDVRGGARLRESPDRPDLARYAIARPDQIDFTRPRNDDAWVRSLEPAQVDRYAALVDRIVTRASQVVCEVLSTMPHPLGQVLARHQLGRFRVTQKASLTDPDDVYRSENARAEDWIMAANHDTDPIAVVTRRWVSEGTADAHAARLAERLCPEDREGFVRAHRDPVSLALAAQAELFASPARHVYVWWNDLFGDGRRYNAPGTIGPENWTIRIPSDFRATHAQALSEGRGLDLPRVLAMALRARKLAPELAAALG